MKEQSARTFGDDLATPETGKSPDRHRSILANCRKLSAINWLLKRSYLDNWVANRRDELDAFAFQLNTGPRKRLGFKPPLEVSIELINDTQEGPSGVR
jgi:hypothetical protein